MNRINLSRTCLALILLSITFVTWGCKKEDKDPFDFEISVSTLEVPLKRQSYLSIKSGNGDYAIKVEHEDVVEVAYAPYSALAFGEFVLEGKKKGVTTVSITDKVTGETAEVTVKVTDFYLPLVVETSDHPALLKSMRMFLVDNEGKDVFFFMEQDNVFKTREKGTYEFRTELKDGVEHPYLLLTYASDGKGQFTDADIAPVVHKFDLSGSDGQFYEIVSAYFGMDWTLSSGVRTKTSPIARISAKMEEVGTDYSVGAYVGHSNWQDYIPSGYLD